MNNDEFNQLRPKRKYFGLSGQWIAFIVGLIMVLLVAGFLLDWFVKPIEMANPDNLARLSRQANSAWNALEAKKSSISSLEQQAHQIVLTYGEDRSAWPQGKPDEYLQLQQQITNLKSSYNSACGDYNGFWDDEWRALPAPDDIPTECEYYQ